MHRSQLACLLAGSLAIAAGALSVPAGAEPVLTSLTADAATVGLWRFASHPG